MCVLQIGIIFYYHVVCDCKPPLQALLHWALRGYPIINASIKVNIIITYFSLANARPVNSVHTSFIEVCICLTIVKGVWFNKIPAGF